MLGVIFHGPSGDECKLDVVNLGQDGLNQPSGHLEAVVHELLVQARDQGLVNGHSPVGVSGIELVQGVNVNSLFAFSSILGLVVVRMNAASDTYSLFFRSL
jgi:hypothetical protein